MRALVDIKVVACAHPPRSVSLPIEDCHSYPLERSSKGLVPTQCNLPTYLHSWGFFIVRMPGALSSCGWDAFKVLEIGNPHVKDTLGNDKQTCFATTKLGFRCKNTRDAASRAQAKFILNQMSLRDPSEFASLDVVPQELKDLANEVLCRGVHLYGKQANNSGGRPSVPLTEVAIAKWRVLINNYIREQEQLRRPSIVSSRRGRLEDDDSDSGNDSSDDSSNDGDSDDDSDGRSQFSVISSSSESRTLSHHSSEARSRRCSARHSVAVQDENEGADSNHRGRCVTLDYISVRKMLKALERLSSQVKTLEEEKATVEQEKTALRQENARLARENQRQKEQIAAMEEEQDGLEDQIEELFEEVNEYMETVQRMTEEIDVTVHGGEQEPL